MALHHIPGPIIQPAYFVTSMRSRDLSVFMRQAAHEYHACHTQRVRTVQPVMDFPNIDGTGSFRNLVEYPCTLSIKIIGMNEGAFVCDMRTLCAEMTGQDESDVPVSWRDRGRYRAITLTLSFQDADQVYAVYAAIDQDPRVKFKL
eukprot:CAMPEP_0119336206 /NCGR_PEP_ID=MMETSP1333-20130426/91333_1 /TAXON_ID=418940 /ORGANISM="Scyphosphaera apsteinii, Strain RCC1455" /LENGTH=145 /DNA_ID=CAMNT_0007346963 /DNA_START=42 /DNA_END=479 /DNA_ORIENTATION=-